MQSTFITILQRDLLISNRSMAETLNPLMFFVLVVCLFPLAVSPEAALLHEIGPGIIWVAALLSTLLALDRLFSSDFTDGCLEQFILAPRSLVSVVSAKILAQWLLTSLPLIVMTPVLGLMFHFSLNETGVLMISLLLGTPVLWLIGAIGTALTIGLRGSGVLLALLVLPLTIPVLIFGAGSVVMVSTGVSAGGLLYLLAAILVLAMTLAPIAAAKALRL